MRAASYGNAVADPVKLDEERVEDFVFVRVVVVAVSMRRSHTVQFPLHKPTILYMFH